MIRHLHMKRRRLVITSAAVMILGVLAAIFFRSSDRDAVATASTWARLAPIPASASDRHVEVKGSMFTREFVITFTAPSNDIRQWLRASPGPASAAQSVSGAVTVYTISPGGGAEFAEVRVDEDTGKVTIHTYWS